MAYTFPPGTDAMAWYHRFTSVGAIGRHVGSRMLPPRGLQLPLLLGWPPCQRRGRRLRRRLLLLRGVPVAASGGRSPSAAAAWQTTAIARTSEEPTAISFMVFVEERVEVGVLGAICGRAENPARAAVAGELTHPVG